jgi:nanoRNase/pAp phosphatase (c-di-AMP/oligoRNAs hydrolase)
LAQIPADFPKTIITSHLNADFDALASCLAAAKLYPGAQIVLPGSQERDLREFLLQSNSCFIDVKRLKDIDLDKVEVLVVVDTRHKSRIGPLALLLERPDVEVHIFDHHPPCGEDIIADKTFFRQVGANTTLMIGLLREKGVYISPEEATILTLGIYEDTGSFTFSSTTSEDLEAAAWLLDKGADLKTISRLLEHSRAYKAFERSFEQRSYLYSGRPPCDFGKDIFAGVCGGLCRPGSRINGYGETARGFCNGTYGGSNIDSGPQPG